jgi:hypothetical protein
MGEKEEGGWQKSGHRGGRHAGFTIPLARRMEGGKLSSKHVQPFASRVRIYGMHFSLAPSSFCSLSAS